MHYHAHCFRGAWACVREFSLHVNEAGRCFCSVASRSSRGRSGVEARPKRSRSMTILGLPFSPVFRPYLCPGIKGRATPHRVLSVPRFARPILRPRRTGAPVCFLRLPPRLALRSKVPVPRSLSPRVPSSLRSPRRTRTAIRSTPFHVI